jgi:hypothetical protein
MSETIRSVYGKAIARRQDGLHRTLGEGSVADLAPPGAAEAADLPHAEGREVVVEHERLGRFALQGFDLLLVLLGPERGSDQRLCFSAREERRAVGARQERHLRADRPRLGRLATIHPDALLEDHPPDFLLLELVEILADLGPAEPVRVDRRQDVMGQLRQALRSDGLLRDPDGVADSAAGRLTDQRLERGFLVRGSIEFPSRLARQFGERALGADKPPALLVREGNRLEHRVLRHLEGPGLDHHHRVFGRGDDQVERAPIEIGKARVHDQTAVDEPDAHRAEGPQERDPGHAHRRGCAVHRQDARVVLLIRGDRERDQLDLVTKALGKERPERPVDEPGGQDLLLGRTPLALEEPAGDPPAGVGSLPIVDAQREEVLALDGGPGGDHGGEHHGVAVAHQDRPVRLLGHAAGLQGEPPSADLDLGGMRCCHVVAILSGRTRQATRSSPPHRPPPGRSRSFRAL